MTGATFREQEDAAGYLVVLRDTVRRHGIPVALYRDRHGIFETPDPRLLTLEEQLADTRLPTQVGRALTELGIASIAAGSPQAKGRVERTWGTLQDRLVTELRLAGAADLAGANEVLARFLPRFNRRFAVPPANSEPAWRAAPADLRPEHVCCLEVPPPGGRRRNSAGRRHGPPAAGSRGPQPRRALRRAASCG